MQVHHRGSVLDAQRRFARRWRGCCVKSKAREWDAGYAWLVLYLRSKPVIPRILAVGMENLLPISDPMLDIFGPAARVFEPAAREIICCFKGIMR